MLWEITRNCLDVVGSLCVVLLVYWGISDTYSAWRYGLIREAVEIVRQETRATKKNLR